VFGDVAELIARCRGQNDLDDAGYLLQLGLCLRDGTDGGTSAIEEYRILSAAHLAETATEEVTPGPHDSGSLLLCRGPAPPAQAIKPESRARMGAVSLGLALALGLAAALWLRRRRRRRLPRERDLDGEEAVQ
jgi:hypothetical protein